VAAVARGMNMRLPLSVFVLWNLASLAITEGSRFADKDEGSFEMQDEDPCINILCHTGQECAVVNGIAACVCKQSCPDHEKPVCGSNGMTFPNHCELHRTACLEGKRISIKYNGTCKGQPTQPPPSANVNQSKPVVCFELDRDEIRSRLIGWLKNQDQALEGLEGYRNLLKSYFELVDENNDGKLDATEFREFIQANQTADEVTSMEEYMNPILQSLCADALLSTSDEDSDSELNITEFMKCLDPEFKPPRKGCELDDEVYSDGTEIPTDSCNSCVCACGQWVCTALKCDETEANQAAAEMREDETERHKLVVSGEEAKEQLTREIIHQDKKAHVHHIQRKVLPLHKPRQHHKHRKHGRHGSRESGHGHREE